NRVERLRQLLGAVIDSSPAYMITPLARADLGPLSPGRRFARRLRAADEALYQEIRLRREQPDLEQRGDVLSLLLRARDEQGAAMSDVELRDELFTMLGAGHETTATGLAFAFDLLLHHPAALARLRGELERGDDDAYLDAVVKETLRLRPVIDAAERTLTEPRVVAGYELAAGVKVYPGIALVHVREDLYPRAHEFRPERFADAGAESYSWLPFGGGSPAVALEHLDGRRLSGAVGAEEGEDLTARDAQVDAAHDLEAVIGHTKASDLDHIADRRRAHGSRAYTAASRRPRR